MPITEREYWRERRQWAVASTDLWSRGKLVSGPLVGIIAYFLQWDLGLRLMVPTLQFIVTLIASYFLVACVQLVLNWVYYGPVALERERLETIHRRDNELEEIRKAQAAIPGAYTQGEIATLARLSREGNELYKVHISQNSADAQLELDKWIETHDTWRDKILAILRDRDVAIFEALVTAGDQTIGHQGALNQVHGNRRGQIVAELKRLERIMSR
jgi:hypothetical protein